eukprot:6810955-Lingulodinium_polyedra.AAC.1
MRVDASVRRACCRRACNGTRAADARARAVSGRRIIVSGARARGIVRAVNERAWAWSVFARAVVSGSALSPAVAK